MSAKSPLLCQSTGVGEKSPALSIDAADEKSPALSIIDIERRRRRLGVSVARLCGVAGINEKSWWRGRRDGANLRVSTLQRLDRGLRAIERGALSPKKTPFWRAFFGFAFAMLAREQELDYAPPLLFDFSVEKPNSPEWLKLARLRRIMIYLLTVEMQVPNADLARAIGCSRQNIKQARDAVEQWRDDPATELLLTRWGVFLREQPAPGAMHS